MHCTTHTYIYIHMYTHIYSIYIYSLHFQFRLRVYWQLSNFFGRETLSMHLIWYNFSYICHITLFLRINKWLQSHPGKYACKIGFKQNTPNSLSISSSTFIKERDIPTISSDVINDPAITLTTCTPRSSENDNHRIRHSQCHLRTSHFINTTVPKTLSLKNLTV